jgi:hypothetical protein
MKTNALALTSASIQPSQGLDVHQMPTSFRPRYECHIVFDRARELYYDFIAIADLCENPIHGFFANTDFIDVKI